MLSSEMMNTKEVTAYLGINDKQVYALIRRRKIPGTRVTSARALLTIYEAGFFAR